MSKFGVPFPASEGISADNRYCGDDISVIISELHLLETEANFLRRRLGSVKCKDPHTVYESFLTVQARVKALTEALLRLGRIP